jgi:hypothetical protein
MCRVFNEEQPMNDTGSYTARKNAQRAAEKMIVDGKAPAVDYAIRSCWSRSGDT